MTSPTIKIDIHLRIPSDSRLVESRLIGSAVCTEENCEFASSGSRPIAFSILPYSTGIMRPVSFKVRPVGHELSRLMPDAWSFYSSADQEREWQDMLDQARRVFTDCSPHSDIVKNRRRDPVRGMLTLQVNVYRTIIDREYLLPLYLSGKFIPLP